MTGNNDIDYDSATKNSNSHMFAQEFHVVFAFLLPHLF